LPTFELRFKKVHTTFEAAWKDGLTRLIRIATDKLKEKKNLKIVVGVECLIVKPREEDETEQTIHAHTMPESIYSEDVVDKFIRVRKAIYPKGCKQELIIRWALVGPSNRSLGFL